MAALMKDDDDEDENDEEPKEEEEPAENEEESEIEESEESEESESEPEEESASESEAEVWLVHEINWTAWWKLKFSLFPVGCKWWQEEDQLRATY